MVFADFQERKLTVRDVAKLTDVNEDTVRRWLTTGQLKGIRLSRKTGWRVSEADLVAFIEQRQAMTNAS